MKVLNIITCVCMVLVCIGARGDTCVPIAFNVSYTCNGGTLSGTLPADTTAQYGSSFSPTAITTSMCAAPSGYVYAGQAVIVNGETVAYYSSTSSKSFTYYYATDIEIGPHWAPVAKPEVLASQLGQRARTYTYTNAASGTWMAEFYYGAVSGVSKCTTVEPENTLHGPYTGLIADYDAVEGASAGGRYCYCKMTQPYTAASPWVFGSDFYGSASSCASNCAYYCGSSVKSDAPFRASVFAAAGD